MALQSQPNLDQFEAYFKRADLDQDGRINGNEAVTFFQGSNLPRQVLAQIWLIADQNQTGYLGRQEFFNALKLVTVAQSKRELTPEIVKAALYGPASAVIPPPKINLIPTPGQQSNVITASSSVPQPSVATSMGTQNIGTRGLQGPASQQNEGIRPPRPQSPSTTFQSLQVAGSQAVPPQGGDMGISYPPISSAQPGGTVISQGGINSQGNKVAIPSVQDGRTTPMSGLPSPAETGVQVSSLSLQPASSIHGNASVGGQVGAKDSRALPFGGNGHASDSVFGNVFSSSPVQTKQDSTKVTSSISSSPAPPIMPALPSSQLAAKSGSFGPLPNTATQQSPGSQHQQRHLPVKSNQQVVMQASAVPNGSITSSGQSRPSWPTMTPTDVQKYNKVFMQVDTDRDGKITGEQARNLFLSWRMPREVLKQVWYLSDQDSDSMLSLREFCIALYLMERYREGHPLPAALPNSIMLDDALSSVSSQSAAAQGNSSWRAAPGTKVTRAAAFVGAGRPPRPVPVPQPEDTVQPIQQKPKVPTLEKHLLNQLSTEEQNSLNAKFQEATDAEKKVSELEKDISDAREKIQFYHAKMQELVLYKSRCDNRLNEIFERVSADKREVDSLAKKYEDKYRQAGDVASKLTIEEATFRDIQDKKMELYRAIVKLEQDGSSDKIEERTSHIQLDLEELVKSLNERCKTYGLRAKPTSLVELPFGWQPGIQIAAADWEENWDKFEDEGFAVVKELTLDVQNVIAPPKPKASLVRDKESMVNEGGVSTSSSDRHLKAENVNEDGDRISEDGENTLGEDRRLDSPPESPARSNRLESKSREFEDSHSKRDVSFDGSPNATQREHGLAESMFSGDKGFGDSSWGALDSRYNADAAWDSNSVATKDSDSERQNDSFLFGSDGWDLNPIKTGSSYVDSGYSKQGPFFDSVPSTPMYNSGSSPPADSFSQKKNSFFDSVPSTPMYSSGGSPRADDFTHRKSSFFDSVPSTPMYNSGSSPHGDNSYLRNSPFAFADSVPSTPAFSSVNSPRRFSEASEGRSFDSFSRFDSFNMQDGSLFTPRESSFSRFDSMRSTRDSEFDHGAFAPHDSFARFDSFRSTADSDYNFGQFPQRDSFKRFDSTRSTRDTDHGHGFSSFDEADPFGSNDPFKTSTETPRRESDAWRAF